MIIPFAPGTRPLCRVEGRVDGGPRQALVLESRFETSDLRRFGALLTTGWAHLFGSPDDLEGHPVVNEGR